ncbi:unnamed protein product [Linum trigynum]|uniref:Reverse transcriptase zinc-binding domain-containing protein n=1 Tax=Linum trigynum TaxID=586398 RepID=A0AAV2CUC3_9ROSI
MSWEKLCRPKYEGGMGFRDFQGFNIALLGRQVWNLLKKPDSLVARVLKARYHPHCDILEATVGSNPSYIWRSLMQAQSLVKEGTSWRVGNGESIRIWWDRRIPEARDFKVQSQATGLGITEKVSSLIDWETRSWKSNTLQTHFQPNDRARIEQIPIPSQPKPDIQIWGRDKTGKYSVRYGYKEWRKRQVSNQVENYVPVEWKKLWMLELPPKVRLFVWRWGSNILPTGVNLSHTIKEAHDECPFCGLLET